MTAGKRQLLANVALSVTATMVALALVELGLRLWQPPGEQVDIVSDPDFAARIARERAHGTQIDLPAGVEKGGLLYVRTPFGMRLRANTTAVIRHHRIGGQTVEIRTNAFGYRNRELGEKTLPRVLFLGDSVTIQDYLAEPDTWVRRVEALAATGPRPIEAVNAGVGGIGLSNELAILSETGIATAPDWVVIDWYLNDFQSSPGITLPPAPWLGLRIAGVLTRALGRKEPVVQRDPGVTLQSLRARVDDLAHELPHHPGNPLEDPLAFNNEIVANFFDWGSAWSAEAWALMRPLFARFATLAATAHFRPLIIAFPVADQVYARVADDLPQRRLVAVARELGIPCLDLLPVLRQAFRDDPGRVLYWDRCHPSPEGSAVVAAAVARFLDEQIQARPR